MNYLAHLFLSCPDEDVLLGNFIADDLRKAEADKAPTGIRKGILLHRRIDAFTDRHFLVRQATRSLRPAVGKYAPVVCDILFDHLLCRHWHFFTTEPFDDFVQRMYVTLENRMDRMPPAMRARLPAMIAANWLYQYATEDGITEVLKRTEKRLKFPTSLHKAMDLYREDTVYFSVLFLGFFPELIQMSVSLADDL